MSDVDESQPEEDAGSLGDAGMKYRGYAPAAFLSMLSLLVVGFGLYQLDAAIVLFMRSFYHPIGFIPTPWLAFVSDMGDRLGKGEVLAMFSLTLLGAGLLFKVDRLRLTGVQTLIAHGVVALLSNFAKHLVGRPRPKFMHAGTEQFAPSLETGWDSFPSGHTSASFAVATVVARYWPRWSWICYVLALSIAASRILRGSHYPTDAFGGLVLGILVGAIVGHPFRDRGLALCKALVRLSPVCVALMSLLWVMGHLPPDGWVHSMMIGAGVACILGGLSGRLISYGWLRRHVRISAMFANAMIAVGLGFITGSWFVTGLVILAAMAVLVQPRSAKTATVGHESVPRGRSFTAAMTEGAVALGVTVAAVIIHGLKGTVPLQ